MLFQSIDFEQVNEFDENAKKNGFIGYAHVYLWRCNEESKSNDEIDIEVYKMLVELDTRLGVTVSEQLYTCLFRTSRLDIIKVRFRYSSKGFKINLDSRF